MMQWLTAKLAEYANQVAHQKGQHGIVANLDVILPSVWFEKMAQSELGQSAVSIPSYQVARLRWTLHEILNPEFPLPEITDSRIASYLKQDSGLTSELARRRFQLADRLARIYSQYLVYRPDWLFAWEAGQYNYATSKAGNKDLANMEAGLLGPLWRAISAKLGRHRGHAMRELGKHFVSDSSPREVVHVFGVSHLAPSEIEVLKAYAENSLVAFYLPDPCREYWGGIESAKWPTYKDDEQARIVKAGDGEYWSDHGHPLLSRWGRMGQHFQCHLLNDAQRSSTRHWLDEQEIEAQNRLQWIQEGIRKLNINVALNTKEGQQQAPDKSLLIHSCHTRQRELEVLRDSLLDALESGIEPGDMMVVSPDIRSYLPLIPSVFGEPGLAIQTLLPYHLADVPVSRSHTLFIAFKQLLGISGLRISGPEVVDLLNVPEIQSRFNLDTGAKDSLLQWLSQTRVAWSLGPSHREKFGVPPIAEHSFAWAMDRMIAGYVMSDVAIADMAQAFTLADQTMLLPITGIQGPSAQAIGALDGLLIEIQAWCDLGASARVATEWAALLDQRLDALFLVNKMDAEAREAWLAIKRIVRELETETASANENPILHFSVVRDLLIERLDDVSERQKFLMGGVTFCGMVPQRAVPFRMLAVLGLNDGEFPRTSRDGGLDLMTKLRRIGDRDVRNDDRYLFLETVMAARDRLHLSYIGEGVKDGKPRNPAAPLAELMVVLESVSGPDGDSPAWKVRHPLQPFNARYFDGSDSLLFSYDSRLAGLQGNGLSTVSEFNKSSSTNPDPIADTLPLQQLAKYYKDPSEHLLKSRLKLSLEALDDKRLREDEPMVAKIDSIATVTRKIFFAEALPKWGDWNPDIAPDWVCLSGLLPPAELGATAWKIEAEAIQAAVMGAMQNTSMLNKEVVQNGKQLAINVSLPSGHLKGVRITGQIPNIFPLLNGEPGHQLLRVFASLGTDKGSLKKESELHFGERVPLFLEWALLRLQTALSTGPLEAVKLTLIVKSDKENWQTSINHWDDKLLKASSTERQSMLDDLCLRVGYLGNCWQEAQRTPHWYFPRVSWAVISSTPKKDASSENDVDPVEKEELPNNLAEIIQNKWSGYKGSGEKNYASGYNALMAGDVDFTKDTEKYNELVSFAKHLNSTISFEQVKAND
jgi:exodeoxyribonuclease V gamma subunit